MINLADKYYGMTVLYWRPLKEQHAFLFSGVAGPSVLLHLVSR